MIKKIKRKVTCNMCDEYRKVKVRRGDPKIGIERLCLYAEDWIDENSEPCPDFRLAEFLWCSKSEVHGGCWSSTVACIETCYSCAVAVLAKRIRDGEIQPGKRRKLKRRSI